VHEGLAADEHVEAAEHGGDEGRRAVGVEEAYVVGDLARDGAAKAQDGDVHVGHVREQDSVDKAGDREGDDALHVLAHLAQILQDCGEHYGSARRRCIYTGGRAPAEMIFLVASWVTGACALALA